MTFTISLFLIKISVLNFNFFLFSQKEFLICFLKLEFEVLANTFINLFLKLSPSAILFRIKLFL